MKSRLETGKSLILFYSVIQMFHSWSIRQLEPGVCAPAGPGKSPLPPRYSAHTTYVRSPDFFSSQSVGQFLPPVNRGFIPPGAHAPLSLACWRSTYFFLRCLFDRCLNKFFYCEKSAVRKILWRLERTNARPLKNSNKQREVVTINQANFHWVSHILRWGLKYQSLK